MGQTDRHKAATGKKSRKGQGDATPSPQAPVPMQARDAADKKAMEVHDSLQDLNRRNGELEVQVGELDAELKKAREAIVRAEARAAESAAKAARIGDLEQEIGALRKQLEQVQTWSAEMSAQAAAVPELKAQVEKAVAAEKAAREELHLAQERHVTVVRAKDEKVAEAEKRARDGMKRLKDAHDSALRDEAARATASEKQAREELKKLQDLHEAAMREAAPLRTQLAELRVQAEKAGELHKDIDALSQQVGQAVGARDKMRRELDEARSLLNHAREELKKAQDLRDESERGGAALRLQLVDLERKLKEAPKDDPRVPALQKELAGLREELKKAQELRTQVADLERKLREVPKEDPRLAPLRDELAKAQALAKDAAAFKARAETAEAKAAESTRYFESIEKELVDALEKADQAEALRAELEKMKEECRDHEEGLDQLSETVMELDHLLELATQGKPATAPVAQAPPPPPPVKAAPVVAAPPPPAPLKVEPVPPPAPKPAVVAAPPPAPKPEPIKIELDFFDPPPSPPPPAPAPVVVPPAVTVKAASGETTLRTNNTFGPDGDDGQPIYLLHEMLPKDAMGVVYRATERSSGRVFAVRFMAGQAGEDQTRAFEEEVEKLISLPHPNILHVQGTGRRKNRLYVMFDFFDAPTLGAAKIQEIPRICAILRDAASALNYAHEEGIFHGDLNPESIVVGKAGDKDHALVKDFGLACLLETQTPGLRNPAFLPPEQVRVLKSALSPAVDVYGLGATLFAALTGRAPFEGKDAAQVIKRVMIEEPPPVEKFRPDVPKAVSAVVRRAMAKERGVRFASAQEMSDALGKFLDAR